MSRTEKTKVLVVEDDPASLEYLRTLLTYAGYDVATAENGKEALAHAKQSPVQLVISDILMPEMDGFELAQKIRSQPELSKVPVLFYSATYEEKQTKWLAEACGVSERLNKPADPEVIVSAVQRALEHPPRPLAADPYFVAEEHARILSEKVLNKVRELTLKQKELEQEIESRKNAQEKIEILEARHRSLMEHLPVGVLAWNIAEERLEVVNPALVKMLGYDGPGPLLARGFVDSLFVGQPGCEFLVGQVLAEKQARHEVQWRRRDGKTILVQLSCFTVQDGKRIIASAQDITHERSLELQVRQDQKLEALGQLAGSVAHDFNNLLMVIMGCTDLLLTRLTDNPQHRKYAEQIRKAAESSAGLTRQLVAFSRKRSSEIKGLELNAVIRELQQILLHLLGKKIQLRIISHEREVWVEADRNHLEQIIVNLVVNARDAMPNGGVLEIESFIQEVDDGKLPPGRYAGLRVTDTGHGIDPEIRSQLFQPFFSTKGDHGTGWGLATVARVVEQSGGDVRVQSAVGLGSTFTVLLREAPARIEPAALRAVQRQGCESILVVDDEAAIRMASREFLSAQGYKVTEAATAIEALTFLQRHVQPVDLIVTDLNMPVMSGLELADQARQIQPGLPVLFISGSVDAGFQQQLAELREKSACIQKPFALTTLVNNIRRLLDGSDSNRQWTSDEE